jgi:hypothetical protein
VKNERREKRYLEVELWKRARGMNECKYVKYRASSLDVVREKERRWRWRRRRRMEGWGGRMMFSVVRPLSVDTSLSRPSWD